MKTYVLDTSVVVKWFSEYDENGRKRAIGLRDEILEGKYFITVPDLMFYELANALRYNPRFTVKDVKDAIQSVIEMEFDIKGVEANIMTRAVEIAFRFNVTIYDAYFLALSRVEEKPFITADYKLVECIKGFKNIVRLSDI
jgi:predicted nucleic acid-binding protein